MTVKNKKIIKDQITFSIAELVMVKNHMNPFYNYFILNIHTHRLLANFDTTKYLSYAVGSK